MSEVQRRRSKSRESKSLGVASGGAVFWRNTIASCSPPQQQQQQRNSRGRARPALRAQSQCYARRLAVDDGFLSNPAYQGSDADLTNHGAERSIPSDLSTTANPSEQTPPRRAPLPEGRLILPSATYTHVPSAISTPARYPVLQSSFTRSQSARGRRRSAASPTKRPSISSPLASPLSQASASTSDIAMSSAVASPARFDASRSEALSIDEGIGGDAASGGKSYDAALFNILKVSAEDLACQITLLDVPVFKAIAPDELTSIAWTTKDKLLKAPNLVALTRRFNQINMWVQTEILNATTVKTRGVIMAHFIKVMKKLFELNNLHSTKAILAALQSAAVFRLAKSWMELGRKDRATFDKIAHVFNEENNNQRLREHLTTLRLQPCIPHMGMFLTDLVYVDVAHPYSGGMESAPRRDAMNNIIRVIADYQASCLMTERLGSVQHHIQAYLNSFRYIEELQKFIEDDYFRLSKRLEPPPSTASASSHDSGCHSPVQFSSPQPKKTLALRDSVGKIAGGGGTPEVVKAFAPNHRKTRSLSKDLNVVQAASVVAVAAAAAAASSVAAENEVLKCQTLPHSMEISRNLIDDSVDFANSSSSATPTSGGHSSRRDDRGGGSSSVKHHRKSLERPEDDEPDLYLRATSASTPDGQVIKMSSLTEDEDYDDAASDVSPRPQTYAKPVACEGCLKRKALLKRGKKPALQNFTRYWVQLSASSLFYYASKLPTALGASSFTSDRSSFKSEPCKMASVRGWMAILGDDPNHPDAFQLTDPNNGTCYKFKAGTRTRALLWCQHLTKAAKDETETPENLISLD